MFGLGKKFTLVSLAILIFCIVADYWGVNTPPEQQEWLKVTKTRSSTGTIQIIGHSGTGHNVHLYLNGGIYLPIYMGNDLIESIQDGDTYTVTYKVLEKNGQFYSEYYYHATDVGR